MGELRVLLGDDHAMLRQGLKKILEDCHDWRVVAEAGACIAWGGHVNLAPADDVLISVERPLGVDTPEQMVASILSKKIAAGSTHIVLDLPMGPTAKVRSPADENCGSCCRRAGDAVTLLRWTGGAEAEGVKPWYNSQEVVSSCPSGTPWCAQCLERDEDELKALAPPTGCDCATIQIGIDPCHARNSCACYCSRLESLKTACPDAH